jgi:hypothetical protein
MLLLRPWQSPGRKRKEPQLALSLERSDVLTAAEALSDLERSDWREHHEKVRL